MFKYNISFGFSKYEMRGEGQARNKPSDFSISLFGRFTYTVSAMLEHCRGNFCVIVDYEGNIRSYQMPCA